MLNLSQLKAIYIAQRDALPLYLAAFLMSSSGGVYVVALPFVIIHLGGTDKHLGIASALTSIVYIITCILIGPVIDRTGPKRYSKIGTAGLALCTAAIAFVVLLFDLGYKSFNHVNAVLIIAMLSGPFLAIFWPPVMGWISIGHEGKLLNQRLGFFNMSWTVGFCASPYIGGLLTEINYVLPIVTAALLVALTFLAVAFTKKPKTDLSHHSNIPLLEKPKKQPNPLLPKFRLIVRIAMIPVFVCMGLAKTQVALLFNQPLGFSESQFGIFMTLLWLTSCILFIALGKTHAWHFKPGLLITAQLLVMLSMLMIIKSSSIWAFSLIALILGTSHAFIYVSHQYYSVSESVNRSGAMAIHEILLSVGYTIGFLGGGYLAENFSRQAVPYWFGMATVAIAFIPQIIIWFLPGISNTENTSIN